MICVFIINYFGIYALYRDHTNRYIRTVTNINNLGTSHILSRLTLSFVRLRTYIFIIC